MGGVYDDYQNAPVVFFDHRLQYPTPIAKAADDTGLTVFPSETQVRSKHYFVQYDPVAMQVFRLIDDGFMPGISVGFDPVPGQYEIIGNRPDGRGKALRYFQWKLLEISHTPLGVNPEALTIAVQKGRVGSDPMHPLITKSLSSLMLPTPVQANGFTPPETKAMATSPEKPKEGKPADEESADAKKLGTEVEKPAAKPAPDEHKDKGEKAPMKPSPAGMLHCIQALHDVHGHMEKAMANAEHPESLEAVEHAKAMVQEAREHVEGALAEHHPEVKAEPPPDKHDEPENKDADQSGKNDDKEEGSYVVKSHRFKPMRFGPLTQPLVIADTPMTDAERVEADRLSKRLAYKQARLARMEEQAARRA